MPAVLPNASNRPPVYALGLLLSLYLAQGLPAGFVTQALPAILRQYEVSLAFIGFSGILLLPWALKFLWAPLVDGYYSPRIGQSRTWILPTQIAALCLVALLGCFDPMQFQQPIYLGLFFACLLAINTLGATQDVATDGLAVRMLSAAERQWGNAVAVVGYRLGLIVGGGGLLLALATLGWSAVFGLMALFIFLNTLPILFFREPIWPHSRPSRSVPSRAVDAVDAVKAGHVEVEPVEAERINAASWREKLTRQFGYFWHNAEMRAWLLVLLLFKVADGLSSGMVKPMMVDMGYSLADIGLLASIMGSISSLLGALMGAFLMRYLSRFTALIGFNALQAFGTGLYAYVAFDFNQQGHANIFLVYGVNAVEHFVAAMALVAMLTCVMDYGC